MSEQTLLSLASIVGGLIASTLTAILGFKLGEKAERNRQALSIRTEMLRPVEEWLDGAERIIQIVSDTIVTVATGSPLPLSYTLDERGKAAQFMAEKTNRVLGIVMSDSLKTPRTNKLATQLRDKVVLLDEKIKYGLLPMDNEILDRSRAGTLTNDNLVPVLSMKMALDTELREAHALIARIKTALT